MTQASKPRPDVGRTVTRIWEDVLGVHVDTGSDFFASGGHSVAVVQILEQVADVYGLELSVRDVFDNPVLADFITVVRSRLGDEERT